jgi:hypothetical protein
MYTLKYVYIHPYIVHIETSKKTYTPCSVKKRLILWDGVVFSNGGSIIQLVYVTEY